MNLTLENLIFVFEEYLNEKQLSLESIIREYMDGDDILFFFKDLATQFNVTFDNLDLYRFFLSEKELNNLTMKAVLCGINQRKITENLTIRMLYTYMLSNKSI